MFEVGHWCLICVTKRKICFEELSLLWRADFLSIIQCLIGGTLSDSLGNSHDLHFIIFCSNVAFEGFVRKRIRASPLMSPFLTLGGARWKIGTQWVLVSAAMEWNEISLQMAVQWANSYTLGIPEFVRTPTSLGKLMLDYFKDIYKH